MYRNSQGKNIHMSECHGLIHTMTCIWTCISGGECVYEWTHHSFLVEVLSPHTILYIMAKYSLLSRCLSSSVILFRSFSFSVYNYICNKHFINTQTLEKIYKSNPKGAIFQRKIASLSGIQTHDHQRSRLKLYQLSYDSYKAGWVQISYKSQQGRARQVSSTGAV